MVGKVRPGYLRALTIREKSFCDNYLANDRDVPDAALKAGYGKVTSKKKCYEILKRPCVQEYIQARTKKACDLLSFSFEQKVDKLCHLIQKALPSDDSPVSPMITRIGLLALAELNKMEGHYAAEKRVIMNLKLDDDVQGLKQIYEKMLIEKEKDY